jgi:hypothetical protein
MSRRILVLYCLLITVLLITDLIEAQQPTKVARLGYLSAGPVSESAQAKRHSAKGCASSDTSREKTLLLSGALERENPNMSLPSRPN